MSSAGVVHLVQSALRDLPGRYNLCTHSLSALFEVYFGELYSYVQQVYEITVRCRKLSTVCLTALCVLGVVHLVCSSIWHLTSRYHLCTHSIIALFGFYFGELYGSVQQVYKNTVLCSYLSTVC